MQLYKTNWCVEPLPQSPKEHKAISGKAIMRKLEKRNGSNYNFVYAQILCTLGNPLSVLDELQPKSTCKAVALKCAVLRLKNV